jgi:hypothetical protein
MGLKQFPLLDCPQVKHRSGGRITLSKLEKLEMTDETTVSKHRKFYDELRDLLRKYNAEFLATDDGRPYGNHSGVIEISFTESYWSDTFTYIDEELKYPSRLENDDS